jgi:tetratricopeptide (TPR) repeat protein
MLPNSNGFYLTTDKQGQATLEATRCCIRGGFVTQFSVFGLRLWLSINMAYSQNSLSLMQSQSCVSCLHVFKPVLVLVLLLLYSAVALASANEDYSKGVALFKQGDYHAAITSFKAAEKKGMESAALFYNLGSAFYKIEQFADSKKYFIRVTEYPDTRALAEFNLGMIALKQDNTALALRHFKYAEANSNSKNIVDRSKQAIAGLTGTSKRWGAIVNAFIGYDDNVSVTPDNVPTGVDDSFANVYASADFVILGKRKYGWLVDAELFRIDFSDSDNFDQDFYTVGLRNEHRFSSWDTKAHIKYGSSTFGGNDLQSFYKLDLLGVKSISGNQKIVLQYRYDDFTSENPLYVYLEGWRQRAQIKYYRNTKKSIHQVYYEGELNNRGELVTSLRSYEYSPVRHTLGGKYTHKLSNSWHLTGDLAYQASDFPASSTVDRDDTRWTLGILLDYRIDYTLNIKSNIRYIQNDSTVDIYNYDKTVFSLGVSKLF